MALSVRLQLRQSQALTMTPQLLQSIRLLQLTHAELERFIEEEVEKNPLLERPEEAWPPQASLADDSPHDELPRDDMAGGVDQLFAEDGTSAQIMAERLDSTMENIFPDDPGASDPVSPDLAAQWRSASGSVCGPGSGSGDFDIDMLAARDASLASHVGEQIAFAFRDKAGQLIAHELAGALDDAGYLCAQPAELAQQLGCSEADILSVLEVCQRFEPPGLFARDLAECLSLQLAARDRLDPAMQAMIGRLDLVARRDFDRLRPLCRVGNDDLLDMLAEIRRLDPRPGTAFTTGAASPIVPDVNVRVAADGGWALDLNSEALPRVIINRSYFAHVSKHAANQADKDFLAECLQNASWLTRSLDQRARTILKVASEIVRQQDAFLLHGLRHLRPLALKDVAAATGMHESTVSRVTSNKYMTTPRGTFELRQFFSVAIAAVDGGDAYSSATVRDRIRELIAAEEVHAVLSDDAVTDILRKDGIDIARRTVAKYREALDIPSSIERRREKRARAGRSR